MKKITILLLLVSSFSCQSLKGIGDPPQCPENYECFTEIEENKSIKALQDTIDKTYLRLEGSKTSKVVKYILKYKDNAMIADDEYVEIIYLQIPNDVENLDLVDAELSRFNLYIQKSCFCRDGGYEKIEQGNLKLRKKNDYILVDLEFDVKMDVKLNSMQIKIEQ